MKTRVWKYRKLWIGIGILILATPVGMILPELFKAGGAWGEWGAEELKGIAGYVPAGLKQISELWSAPISDYSFPGWSQGLKGYLSYAVSALIGVALVIIVTYLFVKILGQREK